MKKKNETITINRACLYLRFSDDKQIGGTSIAVQNKSCRDYCKIHEWKVTMVEKNEAVSARTSNTRRVAELLEFCKKNKGKFEVLVVFKLNRFARDQYMHHYLRSELMKMGILLRSATEPIDETPMGKLTEGILAALAEFDNGVKSELVKAALWRRVEEGMWPWHPPLGYMSIRQKDEKVQAHVPDPGLAQAVVDIFQSFSTGTVSQLDLSKEYKAKKLKNYKERIVAFSPQTISNLLNNNYYAGILIHEDGRQMKGKHKPLISPTLFAKCQYLLGKKSNNRDGVRKYDNPDFPLKHTLSCAECGESLTAQMSNSAHGSKHPHYFCKNKKKNCKLARKTYRKVKLEQDFVVFLKQIKPSKEFVKRFNERFLERYKHRERDLKGEYLRKSEEVKRLNKELDFIIEQGKQGTLKGDTFKNAVQNAESKLSIAKLDLREVHGEEIDVGLLLAYAEAFIQTLEKVWYDAPFEIKKKIQNFVLPGGLYVAKTREGYFFSNPQIHPLFNLIKDFGANDSKLVTPQGIEPWLPG
jgi:site-specific DNA recombinase